MIRGKYCLHLRQVRWAFRHSYKLCYVSIASEYRYRRRCMASVTFWLTLFWSFGWGIKIKDKTSGSIKQTHAMAHWSLKTNLILLEEYLACFIFVFGLIFLNQYLPPGQHFFWKSYLISLAKKISLNLTYFTKHFSVAILKDRWLFTFILEANIMLKPLHIGKASWILFPGNVNAKI